jgi:hypothetical protein
MILIGAPSDCERERARKVPGVSRKNCYTWNDYCLQINIEARFRFIVFLKVQYKLWGSHGCDLWYMTPCSLRQLSEGICFLPVQGNDGGIRFPRYVFNSLTRLHGVIYLKAVLFGSLLRFTACDTIVNGRCGWSYYLLVI